MEYVGKFRLAHYSDTLGVVFFEEFSYIDVSLSGFLPDIRQIFFDLQKQTFF
jgi:hypothetical protein